MHTFQNMHHSTKYSLLPLWKRHKCISHTQREHLTGTSPFRTFLKKKTENENNAGVHPVLQSLHHVDKAKVHTAPIFKVGAGLVSAHVYE
jgi:hypothetical protein